MKVLRLVLFSAPLLIAAACVSAPGAAAPAAAPGVSASPVPSPSPIVSSAATPGVGATPALPPASMEVSPSQVQSGNLTLSLSLEKARHMVDQATAITTDPDPAHQAGGASSTTGSTALVLQGLLQLTNNFNLAQPIPEDDTQGIVRHANVQIRGTAADTTIPYIAATMDMLLDGHPVISNVPLVPMVAAEATSPQLYYGNNVKLMLRGMYQVFVRVQPNALLGKDAPPTAQFNVAVH